MDSRQIWYGNYFKLDQIYDYVSAHDGIRFKESKFHELFITWVLAKFLQWQAKSEHFIGFPTIEDNRDLKISDFVDFSAALDNDNFDTIIIDSKKRDVPIRLQIKRYTKVKDASTEDFFRFLCSNVRRYGKAKELNIVIHIVQDMKFNLPKFGELIKDQGFEVGSIIVIANTRLDTKCFLFEVYPKFTGQLWSPGSPP